MFDRPHRRWNPLTGGHVLVSPHRTLRPWQGRVEPPREAPLPAYDPGCYLCPGNPRAGGRANPRYAGTFAFDNDFPALVPGPAEASASRGLLVAEAETGCCRVLCFSPRHDLTLAHLDLVGVRGVVEAWTEETARLGAREDVACVQVFENKGELMGCSNPHPHSQIWATRLLPDETVRELERQEAHYARHRRPLLEDVLALERERGERVVLENEAFVVLVPFWAAWPFETLVLPRERPRTLLDLDDRARTALADVLRRLAVRYDNLFGIRFPYSLGFHQAPFDGRPHPEWLLHLHAYPPLLRGPGIRKFMVGFEMLGMPGRDITPEEAAGRLRSLPDERFVESC